MICHLVGAGDFAPERFRPLPEDFVIACDAGLSHLEKIGVFPDLIVGDFDSYRGPAPSGEKVVTLPREKDDTDMLYAARVGLSRGYDRFFLHGCLGGERFSHSLSNLSLLFFLFEHGAKGLLIGKKATVGALINESLTLSRTLHGYVSVFAANGPCEALIDNLKYPFAGSLSPSFPLGVSNEFIGREAHIAVRGEALFVIEAEGVDLRALLD